MAKHRITTELVTKLAPGAIIFDTEVRGFMVRRRVTETSYGLKTRVRGRHRPS